MVQSNRIEALGFGLGCCWYGMPSPDKRTWYISSQSVPSDGADEMGWVEMISLCSDDGGFISSTKSLCRKLVLFLDWEADSRDENGAMPKIVLVWSKTTDNIVFHRLLNLVARYNHRRHLTSSSPGTTVPVLDSELASDRGRGGAVQRYYWNRAGKEFNW